MDEIARRATASGDMISDNGPSETDFQPARPGPVHHRRIDETGAKRCNADVLRANFGSQPQRKSHQGEFAGLVPHQFSPRHQSEDYVATIGGPVLAAAISTASPPARGYHRQYPSPPATERQFNIREIYARNHQKGKISAQAANAGLQPNHRDKSLPGGIISRVSSSRAWRSESLPASFRF
jgi:hypothetical protein